MGQPWVGGCPGPKACWAYPRTGPTHSPCISLHVCICSWSTCSLYDVLRVLREEHDRLHFKVSLIHLVHFMVHITFDAYDGKRITLDDINRDIEFNITYFG